MEVFRWNPLIDLNVDHDEKIKEVSFGDGHEQVSPDGLNSIRRVFNNMRFVDYDDGETEEVKDFFLRHGRSKSFRIEINGYSAIVRFNGPLKIQEKGANVQDISTSMKEVFR